MNLGGEDPCPVILKHQNYQFFPQFSKSVTAAVLYHKHVMEHEISIKKKLNCHIGKSENLLL
jgi:hypothetical protein